MRRVMVDGFWRIDPIVRPWKHDTRHYDTGLGRQTLFDRIERRLPGNGSIAVAIGMDHDPDEIGVVESSRAAIERVIVKTPCGRP